MKKEVLIIIAIFISITVVIAFIMPNLTGNIIKIGWWNKQSVYTVEEVDELIENLNDGGETPVYYTKSQIDSLISNLAGDKTGVIGSNDTYSKSEIDNKINSVSEGITKQEVLGMLNTCEIVRSASGLCDQVCNEKKKTCIFGDATFQVQSNTESLKINHLVACQEEDVQSLVDIYTQAGYTVQDIDASCVCCST